MERKMIMAKTLQNRLDTLVVDVQAIRKELFLSKLGRKQRSRRTITSWANLSNKVSAAWDSVSAVDEITAQREKLW
jgi:hypothetical protein